VPCHMGPMGLPDLACEYPFIRALEDTHYTASPFMVLGVAGFPGAEAVAGSLVAAADAVVGGGDHRLVARGLR
jgi:hypothetical protein